MTSDSANFWPWALHSTGSAAAAADGKQRIRVQIRRTVPITAEITDNKTDILDFIFLFTHLSKWQRMNHIRLSPRRDSFCNNDWLIVHYSIYYTAKYQIYK